MALKPSPTFVRLVVLLALLSLAPVTLYILYQRTGGLASGEELTFHRNLRFALMSGNEAVDLAPLTDWPWVKVCAVDSGVSADELNAIVGFPYKNYGDLTWIGRTDFWTLLFIDKPLKMTSGTAQPVMPVRISRKDLADLALPEGAKGQCIARGSGRIEVTRRAAPVGVSPAVLHLVDSDAD
jgi:hypothetical protein